jgi:hypothetical protein
MGVCEIPYCPKEDVLGESERSSGEVHYGNMEIYRDFKSGSPEY